jgi:hypothetical protein
MNILLFFHIGIQSDRVGQSWFMQPKSKSKRNHPMQCGTQSTSTKAPEPDCDRKLPHSGYHLASLYFFVEWLRQETLFLYQDAVQDPIEETTIAFGDTMDPIEDQG